MANICCHCKNSFASRAGLKSHRKGCKERDASLQSSVNQRNLRIKEGKAKIQQREQQDITREREQLREHLNQKLDLVHPDIAPDVQDAYMRSPTPQSAETTHILPPTRSGRIRKAPRHHKDYIPSTTTGVLHAHISQLLPPPPPASKPTQAPVESPPSDIDPEASTASVDPLPESRTVFETEPNEFGVYRMYGRKPRQDIAEEDLDNSLCDSPSIATAPPAIPSSPLQSFGRAVINGIGRIPDWFSPFLNATAFRLMHWAYTGSNQKSTAEIERLVHQVLLAPDFNQEDLRGFRMNREERRLDEHATASGGGFPVDEGWHEATVHVPLPKEKIKYKCEEEVPRIEIQGVWHRKLLDVIVAAYQDKSVSQLVSVPYQLQFQQPEGKSERVYTEGYTCDALIDEDAKIQSQPRNPEDADDVEYSVVPLMLWSDSTHLANFGTASLWPIYLYLGNLSKYVRSKPSSFAAHHLAYIPSLPDTIQDLYHSIYDIPATKNVLKFCKNHIIHAIWLLLMDDSFMDAYEHGIRVNCGDHVIRRLFPRFFTYSADYPERILLACLRFLGRCPCATCYILKTQVPDMGMKYDQKRRDNIRRDTTFIQSLLAKARKLIFEWGKPITSKSVESKLQPLSLQPVRSAFSLRLAKFGFNHYAMYAYDLLHGFELGVWKAIFTHILRVLYAEGGDKIQILNRRFRQVPTFGRDTIRRFSNNVSGMKKLAARNFEDILQCVIPCIEGLLPPTLDKIVLDLLWDLAVWHALAKLRLHTDSTLRVLEKATTYLGSSVRRFARACDDIDTRELPHEEAARGRRQTAKGKGTTTTGKKRKTLNLQTSKWHDLGHVPARIRSSGTTDNYSTQVVGPINYQQIMLTHRRLGPSQLSQGECEHKRVKRMYARTNKRKHEGQIAAKDHREGLLVDIKKRDEEVVKAQEAALSPSDSANLSRTHENSEPQPKRKRGRPRKKFFGLGPEDNDHLPQTSFDAHHHMSDSRRFGINIPKFLAENSEDPGVKGFLPSLKDHILSRLTGRDFDGDECTFSDDERGCLKIVDNRLFRHKVIRVNYTTYDMRRNQDSINPRTHADVMVLAPEEDIEDKNPDLSHPYWYARIVGIFHAKVRYTGPGSTTDDSQKIEFLWVRWFGRDLSAPGGFGKRRLHRIGFADADQPGAFGFLDPQLVIRAVHLIPAFHYGRTSAKLGPSILCQPSEGDEDWDLYYVN
ncbi:hypothetical protein PHLCEN_2v9671, partial [Hermanssonia centrifuga]